MNYSQNKGFTLIELMVAMVIASILLAAIISAYRFQVSGKNIQESMVDMNQTARAALEIMITEIRMAGFDPLQTAGAGILIANANELSFNMDIGDGASFQPNGQLGDPNESVRYAINGDGHLGRDAGDGSGLQPLARNVDALNFVYLGQNNNVLPPPANVSAIRAIQLTIVARAGESPRGFMGSHTDNTAYRNQQGDTIFTAPGDSFRRLLLTTTINCNNIGL